MTEEITWEPREVDLKDQDGNVIYKQTIEAPVQWSDRAVAVVGSHYLHKQDNNSISEMIDRILCELCHEFKGTCQSPIPLSRRDAINVYSLIYFQAASFNSPVWFNLGVKARPQCSACFINSVDDTMESILELCKTEGLLFRHGSGTGTNFSSLRAKGERLSNGGQASGPVSFMKGYDAFAGVIKSGGKLRRAAKMVILDVDHPDIEEFVDCKLIEEKKAQTLIKAGYSGGLEGEAYNTVAFQNGNNSVRLSDEFMHNVKHNQSWSLKARTNNETLRELPARDLLRKIAEAAHSCGDPGIQFDDTINVWNTCSADGLIKASNPCSEFMFLDNSACNLASLNLMKFVKIKPITGSEFDVDAFRDAVHIMVRAQDAIVDISSYPTEEIEKNSKAYRPLGLGYTNLGALLMSLGVPYDSDVGRCIAANITALMTAQAYITSSELARSKGPFKRYDENKESVLSVLELHKHAMTDLFADNSALFAYGINVMAAKLWDQVLNNVKKYGLRNAQVTLLAPTGTISFMMDCDTTGIEPEFALVKTKTCVGGNTMRIVNQSVKRGLKTLGYHPDRIDLITDHIKAVGTIEGAMIEDCDLNVFDCSLKPSNGKRSIDPMGHLKMMAAVQPFLSGAISKTVNLPNKTTVEQIEEIIVKAHEMGLKSIALYRDGSKLEQPLKTEKTEKKSEHTYGLQIEQGSPPTHWVGGSQLKKNLSTEENRKYWAHVEKIAEEAKNGKWQKGAINRCPCYLEDIGEEDETEVEDMSKETEAQEEKGEPQNEEALSGDLAAVRPSRQRLPNTRHAVTHKFTIGGHEGYITVGLYDTGSPGEVFITMSKEGSTISGLMDALATSISIALQYGVPLRVLVDKFSHMRFEPSGFTGNSEIPLAKSILDYVARWLEIKFLKEKSETTTQERTYWLDKQVYSETMGGLAEATKQEEQATIQRVDTTDPHDIKLETQTDSPLCASCGCLMTRSGTCYTCLSCGSTSGGCS